MRHPVNSGDVLRLERLDDLAVRQLADVLVDCVNGGASVSFMAPLSIENALAYWSKLREPVAEGRITLLAARDSQGIVGTVQMVPAPYENQPHRADIAKMLVHSRGRRRGLGTALMKAAEAAARDAGRSVLVLDTIPNSDAARLYERLGWRAVGEVPDFALMPDGALTATCYYYRHLLH